MSYNFYNRENNLEYDYVVDPETISENNYLHNQRGDGASNSLSNEAAIDNLM